jgi:hypothetical protein
MAARIRGEIVSSKTTYITSKSSFHSFHVRFESSKMCPLLQMASRIRGEIVSSETTYVASLRRLCNDYVTPLARGGNGNNAASGGGGGGCGSGGGAVGLSSAEHAALFANAAHLLALASSECSCDATLCCFLAHAHKFHDQYATSHPTAHDTAERAVLSERRRRRRIALPR